MTDPSVLKLHHVCREALDGLMREDTVPLLTGGRVPGPSGAPPASTQGAPDREPSGLQTSDAGPTTPVALHVPGQRGCLVRRHDEVARKDHPYMPVYLGSRV